MSASRNRWRALLPLLLLTLSCGRLGRHRDGAPAPSAESNAPSAPGTPSDANIVAIVLAANNADILYGTLAAAKSPNAEIRRFAATTVRDHQAVNQAATALATKIGLIPEDNAASFDLRDNAEDKRGQLRDLEGAAFDRAYVENEITYHTRLLATIDDQLAPSARNAELGSLLTSVRPAVAAHLEHARSLLAAMTR